MLLFESSSLNLNKFSYIQQTLRDLSENLSIRILLAVESGSRAWGFPSKNSDYDVRFIYVRPFEDYLSVRSYGDVLEIPMKVDQYLGVPLDLHGWDIRKALQLAIQSNAVLSEWLMSPLHYMSNLEAIHDLLHFVRLSLDKNRLFYHYDRLARNSWNQILKSTDAPKIKLYCYVLRPVLVLEWLRHFEGVPPMDLPSLCEALAIKSEVMFQIQDVIQMKKKSEENAVVPRSMILDHYILSILETKADKPKADKPNASLLNDGDQLFRKLIHNPEMDVE